MSLYPADLHSTTLKLAVALCLFALSGTTSFVRAQISPGPLSEAHAELEGNMKCLECHGGADSRLNDNCLKCHRGVSWLVERKQGLHGRQSAQDCAHCHPEHGGRRFELIHWEEGSLAEFDHIRSGWPLEGKHALKECADCHKPELQTGAVVSLRTQKDSTRSWLGLEPACLSCHSDNHRGTLGEDCLGCHGFRKWKPASEFDHDRTGYALTGKHREVECKRCHLVPGKVELRGESGQPLPLYKPVPHAECSACHTDPHAGLLGVKCSSCHLTDTFRSVDRERFDHSRTRFPLMGRHRALECAKCHDPQKAWGRHPRFESCGSCHLDAHAGTATREGLKMSCGSCHNEQGFKPSTYTVVNHDSTSFPLAGKHRSVACASCHPKNPPGISPSLLGTSRVHLRPVHETCRDCHKDAHGGQLADRDDRGSCEVCHSPNGWTPSKFGSAEHDVLRVTLEGRHGEVECRACHGSDRRLLPPLRDRTNLGKAGLALTTLNTACDSCHVDPHEGRFSSKGERPKLGGCRGCHGMAGFRPAAVDVEVHSDFTFSLKGGHRAVPCISCHKELTESPSTVSLLGAEGTVRGLSFVARHDRCDLCHEGPHGDQFEDRPAGGACDLCHDATAFRPAARFDHLADSPFTLRGAHEKVPCASCHAARPTKDGPQVVYRPVPDKCQSCHGSRHEDGESSRPGED